MSAKVVKYFNTNYSINVVDSLTHLKQRKENKVRITWLL